MFIIHKLIMSNPGYTSKIFEDLLLLRLPFEKTINSTGLDLLEKTDHSVCYKRRDI